MVFRLRGDVVSTGWDLKGRLEARPTIHPIKTRKSYLHLAMDQSCDALCEVHCDLGGLGDLGDLGGESAM